MSIGWMANLAEANTYFTNERLETYAWEELANDAIKQKVLINAYNRLYYDPRFNLPTFAEATAAELVILKKANCEMSYYLAQHLGDEDRRKGLQAQAVIKAGIVKEDYFSDMLMSLPIPPFVLVLLSPWKKYKHLFVTDIDRDEDLCVDDETVVDCGEDI